MRDKLVEELNELLEIDHDAVAGVYLAEMQLSAGSRLNPYPCAYDSAGVRVVSALSVLNHCIEGHPIAAVVENGIIQRFE